MSKWGAVFSGLFALGMSLLIYPYVNEYMVKPAYTVAQLLVPDMLPTDHLIWKAMPYVILFLIFFLCALIGLGKVKAMGGGKDDDRGDEE